MKPRIPAFRVLLLITSFILITNGVAFASTGSGSFMFHRYGASISPTNEFYWEDGSVSTSTCASADALPTVSRLFAPSSDNTSLTQFISNNKWVVQASFQWDYAAGTAWNNFEVNKPISGALFYLTEAHVNRGWHWDSYYSTLPGTEQTHSSSGAIYKDDHVEADIWIEDPGQLAGNTEYTVQWTFSPESGQSLYDLSKAYGHAHGIYIYRYWNAIHVAAQHGDPMDKISWRDDLGTFGSNATCTERASAAASSLVEEQVQPELVSSDGSVSVYRDGDKLFIAPLINSVQDLNRYVQQRSQVLSQLDPDRTTTATVTFHGVTPEKAGTLLNGVRVLRFGFATRQGSGEQLDAQGIPLTEALQEMEQVYGITISEVQYATVEASGGRLARMQTQPGILLVDPAVDMETGEIQPIESPRSLYQTAKRLGGH